MHSVDIDSLNLDPKFASKAPFFDRQIKTFERLARAQAQVKDAQTCQAIGLFPGFETTLATLKATRPRSNEITLVHGAFAVN